MASKDTKSKKLRPIRITTTLSGYFSQTKSNVTRCSFLPLLMTRQPIGKKNVIFEILPSLDLVGHYRLMTLPLQELLVTVLSSDELQMFVADYDRQLMPHVGWKAPLARQVFELVNVLIRENKYTDPALYQALRASRPGFSAKIDAAERAAQQAPNASAVDPGNGRGSRQARLAHRRSEPQELG